MILNALKYLSFVAILAGYWACEYTLSQTHHLFTATGSSQNLTNLDDYLLVKKSLDKVLIRTKNEKVSTQATL